MRKITLLIAGAQKAGTTSLNNYLGQHPEIQTHVQKEFAYFVDESAFSQGYDVAHHKYFMPVKPNAQLIAKSAGMYIHEKSLARLKEHNPECRIAVILRNPIERTYSSFLMERNYGAIHEPFNVIKEIMRKADPSDWRYEFFVGMSLYSKKLPLIYTYFPKEQVKIIRFEELKNNAGEICRDIFGWMNLDTEFVPDTTVRHNVTTATRSNTYGKILQRFLSDSNPVKKAARVFLPGRMDYKVGEAMRKLNTTGKKNEPIPQDVMEDMLNFFRPYNDELSSLTGYDFSAWNKINQTA
jgi:hypothetical protein